MNDQAALDMQKLMDEMPDSTITIQAGRVVSLSDWTLWNLEPCETTRICRNADGTFTADIGEPEHGGRVDQGEDLVELLTNWLHPNIRGPIIEAFALQKPLLCNRLMKRLSKHFCLATKLWSRIKENQSWKKH